MRRPTMRSLAGGAAGIAAGILGGIALSSVSAGSLESPLAPQLVDGAHVPPLLTLPGEPVTLRYAIVCSPREDGQPCDASGEVYARAGQTGSFQRLALRRGEDSRAGRYFVDLPAHVAGSADGFSYYAVLRDDGSGLSITLPSGGAAAPQRSFPLRHAQEVELGAHSFGQTRSRTARVIAARWGSAVGEAGVAGSRELGFVGPSSFDVDPAGNVTVLDQVNGRLQRWARGQVTTTPIDVSGGLADLAVEPDGTVDVLEPPNRETRTPVLRSFDRNGAPRWAQRLSDRTWSKLDVGPDGPVVQQQPSEQWLPAGTDGSALDRATQAKQGRPGRPFAKGRELLVQRVGAGELRVAELAGNGIVRAWRVRSTTTLGEVQLAEPMGNRVVVVAKTYTDDRDEYVALVLDRSGVAQRLSLDTAQWAETAPLGRFRLSRSSLYQLGSTPSGAFVDRFDLEVSQ
jgi:hypothetical protein